MIRVLLADDHGVIRDGLGRLIAALRRHRARRRSPPTARRRSSSARALEPDVVLMDLDMPRARRHRGDAADRSPTRPETAVLVLTSFSDRPRILGALEAGACGYLLKDVDAEEVAEGIRAAARGESPLDPRAARTRPRRARRARPARRRSPRASARCSALLVEGLPNKLIARRLEISEKTVKSHLTRIFRELGVTDRTQAALWAERHGLAAAGLSPTKVPLRARPAARHDARRHVRPRLASWPSPSPSPLPRPRSPTAATGQDVRVAGTCGNGATSKLRLRRKDGAIRVEFEVDAAAPASAGASSSCTSAASSGAGERGRGRAAAPSGSGARSPTSPAPTRSRPAPPARAATRARPARC